MMMFLLSILVLTITPTQSIDNGIGVSPPMGWRSWNQFQCNINQSMIEETYSLMASKSRNDENGKPTSLLDLGYVSAGIDDCWQKCDSGPSNQGFHNASGYPIVDETKFWDMRSMTYKAKTLGVIPGWYGNNCRCKEQQTQCHMNANETNDSCFRGDVEATLNFGFESIKLDGCGDQKNVTHYAKLFNESGVPVMIENCHNGLPTYPYFDENHQVVCPMNFFRSSTDIRPTFGSVLINLRTTSAYNDPKLTGPGCWSYPDMLEVGVTNSQHPNFPTLSFVEARTHFSAWCIVSSPLVLGNDLRDQDKMDEIWPIISNREAIAVNQAWAGDSGTLIKQSDEETHFSNCSWFNNDGCSHPSFMIWKKVLAMSDDDDKTVRDVAVLLMNNANVSHDLTVDFAQDLNMSSSGSSTVTATVRDIHAHKDLGNFVGNFTAKSIGPRDSAFVVITTATTSSALSKLR